MEDRYKKNIQVIYRISLVKSGLGCMSNKGGEGGEDWYSLSSRLWIIKQSKKHRAWCDETNRKIAASEAWIRRQKHKLYAFSTEVHNQMKSIKIKWTASLVTLQNAYNENKHEIIDNIHISKHSHVHRGWMFCRHNKKHTRFKCVLQNSVEFNIFVNVLCYGRT